ncbi:nucleoside 2-deoxyribosyltransferase [Streptomyces sp. NPDC050560]|uniref:nucleoside 2-deoxyribosyltransferase n=1 Tax=Streptomyces sp. NPDC050560 TaxID=3365630 RepID=UPI0037ADC6B2
MKAAGVHDGADLTGIKVFVGGPIQYAIEEGSFYSPLHRTLHGIIGALQEAGGTVFSAHVAEKFGIDTPLFSPQQVSVRDFGWMRRCDVFVPVLPVRDGDLLRTDGTHVEMGWASALGKPIALVTRQPLASGASHLLRGLPEIADVSLFDDIEVAEDPGPLLTSIARSARRTVSVAS